MRGSDVVLLRAVAVEIVEFVPADQSPGIGHDHEVFVLLRNCDPLIVHDQHPRFPFRVSVAEQWCQASSMQRWA